MTAELSASLLPKHYARETVPVHHPELLQLFFYFYFFSFTYSREICIYVYKFTDDLRNFCYCPIQMRQLFYSVLVAFFLEHPFHTIPPLLELNITHDHVGKYYLLNQH